MIIAEIQQENTFWKNPLERHVSLSEWKQGIISTSQEKHSYSRAI